MFDLDHIGLHPQLLRNYHRHDRLSPSANIAHSHVQVHASVRKELHHCRGRWIASACNPETASHTDSSLQVAFSFGLTDMRPRFLPSESLCSLNKTLRESSRLNS